MRFLFLFFTLFSLFSCQKFDWNNPYDPECPKELFTPSSPGVTMEGNSVKLTWSQQNNDISGFALFRRVEDESIVSLSQIQKNTTQYLDANITPGKKYTYYVVAVAGTNSSDTVKAEIVPVFPVTVSTGVVTELAFTSAKLSGNLTSAGGGTVTSRGICWSTTPSPTVNNSKTIEGTGIGVFTSVLTNLLAGTTYYARAYGENSRGISYGSEVTFTTLGLPTLSTAAVSNIATTTATSGGTITTDGGAPVSAKGVVWSTSTNPTVDLATKTNEGPGAVSFTSSLVGLAPNVKYFVRAYATNANGTSYGQEISFTTLQLSSPTLTTSPASSITTNSAISGGNITGDGGAPVTARGICWNTTGSPTIVNTRTQDGSGTGAFTSSISGLAPNTTYFVRSYATNGIGTSYGNEVSFKTSCPLPVVTLDVSALTWTAAPSAGMRVLNNVYGTVTNDWGLPVSGVFIWSETRNPPGAGGGFSYPGQGNRFGCGYCGFSFNTGAVVYIQATATNTCGEGKSSVVQVTVQ